MLSGAIADLIGPYVLIAGQEMFRLFKECSDSGAIAVAQTDGNPRLAKACHCVSIFTKELGLDF